MSLSLDSTYCLTEVAVIVTLALYPFSVGCKATFGELNKPADALLDTEASGFCSNNLEISL